MVKWLRGDEMLSTKTANVSKGVVRNVVNFPRLLREHLMMPLICEVSNTNLTVPVTKNILIDLNCKCALPSQAGILMDKYLQ